MTAGPARPRATGTLAGRTVLVTRPRDRSVRLVAALEARGAVAVLAPAIRLAPAPPRALDRVLDRLADGAFAWAVFTSPAGVEAVLGRLQARGLGAGGVRARVAAVGEATARALRDRGVRPELVPDRYTTAALGRVIPGGRGEVLLARADIAPEGLEDALVRKGWTPTRLEAYRTRLAGTLPRAAREALVAGRVDAVTFTSASTVRGFLRLAGPLLAPARDGRRRRPRVVCIGPVTAAAARAEGLRVDATADPHTIEGLLAALERALGAPDRGRRADRPRSP